MEMDLKGSKSPNLSYLEGIHLFIFVFPLNCLLHVVFQRIPSISCGFQVKLIAVVVVHEEILVDLLKSYHTPPGVVLFFKSDFERV
jgi:hypothetical protein